MPTDDEKLMQMLFMQMVFSLNEGVMMQLGKIVNPTTGKTEIQLDQAKMTIDMLRMLKAKTEGRLSEPEQRMLDSTLMNVQMNFVYEKDKAAAPAPAPAPEESKPTTETPPAESQPVA
jgi:hypothetical protein